MKASVSQSLARLFCCVGIVASAASASAQSISLPGTIQIEDFDQGAAGVAYHDLSGGNSGDEYRATDVDIEACDEGGSTSVGSPWRVVEVHGEPVTERLSTRWSFAWRPWAGRNVPHGGERRRPNRSNQHSRYRWVAELDDRHEVRSEPQRRLRRRGDSSLMPSAVTGASGTSTTCASPGRHRARRRRRPIGARRIALPGTVQLEDFDNGGEGNAYHDLSARQRGRGVSVNRRRHRIDDRCRGRLQRRVRIRRRVARTTRSTSLRRAPTTSRFGSHRASGRHIPHRSERRQQDRTFTVPDTGGWQDWVTLRRSGHHALGGPAGLQAGHGFGRFRRCRRELQLHSRRGRNGMVGGGGSTPYTGTAVALPGTVQFEAFDNGGEGVAFHDLSSENRAAITAPPVWTSSRPPMPVAATTSAGPSPGEWLAYTVNVAAAGTYDIEARVASSGTGRTFPHRNRRRESDRPDDRAEHWLVAIVGHHPQDRPQPERRAAGLACRARFERFHRRDRQLELFPCRECIRVGKPATERQYHESGGWIVADGSRKHHNQRDCC